MVRPGWWTFRGQCNGRPADRAKTFATIDTDICRDMDWTRMRTGHGRGLSVDIACPLPARGHVLDMDLEAGHGADIPRPFRGHFADTESFAGEGVGLTLG
jgi:hypothetical protein